MVLTNREKQARFRRRASVARGGLPGVLDALEQAIAMTERACEQERARGTKPDDGTAAGKLLAEQETWVEFNRRQLANAREQEASHYQPSTTALASDEMYWALLCISRQRPLDPVRYTEILNQASLQGWVSSAHSPKLTLAGAGQLMAERAERDRLGRQVASDPLGPTT
jgi:hypothetical protein